MSKVKESRFHVIWYAPIAFLLCGADRLLPSFTSYIHIMLCDQAKWVFCWALSNFGFIVYLSKHWKCFILLKIPSKSVFRFGRYGQFWQPENNKITREISYQNWLYLKINMPTTHSLDRLTYLPICPYWWSYSYINAGHFDSCTRYVMLHNQ